MADSLRKSLTSHDGDGSDEERDIEEPIQSHETDNVVEHNRDVPASQNRDTPDRQSPPHGSQNGAAQNRSSMNRELSVNRELLSVNRELSGSREPSVSSNSSADYEPLLSPNSPHRVRWSIGNRPISVSRTGSKSRASSFDVDSVFYETINSISEEPSSLASSSQLSTQSSSSSTFNKADIPQITLQSTDHRVTLRRRWSSEADLRERRTISRVSLDNWATQHVHESQIIERDQENTITFMQSMRRRIYSILGAFGPAWYPILVVFFYMFIFTILLLVPQYFL